MEIEKKDFNNFFSDENIFLSYEELDHKVFKYFKENDTFKVIKNDLSFLPKEYHNKKEARLEKIDFIVKDLLLNKKTAVEEYKIADKEDFNKIKEGKVLKLEGRPYFRSKIGYPSNFKDFLDICISDKPIPSICSIYLENDQVIFSYIDNNKIKYTNFYDDDLFSICFSLIQKFNCIEILFNNKNLQRIFNSWGINNIFITKKINKVKLNFEYIDIISSYFNLNIEKSYFEYKDFCLINIKDFDLIDLNCDTNQGKRLLMQWLRSPLINRAKIEKRLNFVEFFYDQNLNFKDFSDIKRLMAKILNKSLKIEEIIKLHQELTKADYLIKLLSSANITSMNFKKDFYDSLLNPLININKIFIPILTLINQKINFEKNFINIENNKDILNLINSKDKIIEKINEEFLNLKKNINKIKLDENFNFKVTRKDYNENKKSFENLTVINISKNVVFTTKRNSELLFELKKINEKILYENKNVLEDINNVLIENINSLEIYNYLIALMDVYKFLRNLICMGFTRPRFSEEYKVKNGYHPLIKMNVIKNTMEFEGKNVCVLTGPNMGGKSTFIKMLSMVSLFAQIGSYVPAEEAVLPIFDRILMRSGAKDCTFLKMSTFMSEMVDLNKMLRVPEDKNKRNLVLIDELGRGTGNLDGLSIIIAVKEFLFKRKDFLSVITTHFHELNDDLVINKKVVVENGIITFKIENGKCDGSFAIKIGEMVNLPLEIIENAKKYLKEMK